VSTTATTAPAPTTTAPNPGPIPTTTTTTVPAVQCQASASGGVAGLRIDELWRTSARFIWDCHPQAPNPDPYKAGDLIYRVERWEPTLDTWQYVSGTYYLSEGKGNHWPMDLQPDTDRYRVFPIIDGQLGAPEEITFRTKP